MLKKLYSSDHHSFSFTIFFLITTLILISSTSCEELSNNKGTYSLIAPIKLRPNSIYHVSITLHPTANESIYFDLKVSVSGNDFYLSTNSSALLRPGETRILSFMIGDWKKGNKCQLTLLGKGKEQIIRKTADLEFEPKSHLVFVQTDKAFYRPGQTILFRVVTVNFALLPVFNHTLNIYILDSQRNRLKHWSEKTNLNGVYENQFEISTNPIFGKWSIEVEFLDQQFTKTITIEEYVLPSFDVDLEIPNYATINQPIVVATIKAKYSFNKPVNNAEAELIILPKSNLYSPRIQPITKYQIKKALENGFVNIPINLVKDLNLSVNKNFNQELEFKVKVEDLQTGKKQNQTKTLQLFEREIEIEPIINSKTFKPGLPVYVKLKVAYLDGRPVENTNEFVTLKYGFNYNDGYTDNLENKIDVVPKNGIADAVLFLPKNLTFNCIYMKAFYKNISYDFNCLEAMQSKSMAFLQIKSDDLSNGIIPKVNQQVNFEVNCTEKITHLVYHVISRGDIVLSKSVNFSGSKDRLQNVYNFNFEVTAAMSPKAKLIVYYIRPNNKEIIADSIKFEVNNLFKTPVKITTSEKKTKPGNLVTINVETKPHAFVGLLAVDQSVLTYKSGNDITQDDVVKELEIFDEVNKIPDYYRTRRSIFETNSNDIFFNAGLILLTDGNILSTPPLSYYRSGLLYVNEAVFQNKEFEMKEIKNDNLKVRSYFPETWLWSSKLADENGDANFVNKVPDTITSWVISSFAIDPVTGLGIASNNANLTVFRKFFVKLNLPYSVIRGEVVSVQVQVFNYDTKPLETEVTLMNEYRQFNFSMAVDSKTEVDENINKASKYKKRIVTVPAGDSVSVSFLITSNLIGAISLKVNALCSLYGDSVIKTLLIKPEGETQYRNDARLINLEKNNKFSERFNISLPKDRILGSGFMTISLIGDVIGSSLSNMNDLVRLPYGCGEQNMIHFVPNIVILNYLKQTHKLKESMKNKILKYIEIGYQTELKYKRADGSFSAFGNSDKEGSTWLTAFVLKSFLMAKSFLPIIDLNITSQAANWLIQHQLSDGSFDEPGEVHYKPLQGSTANGQATLTAFVVIAFYQQKELATIYQGQLNKALSYLNKQVQNDYVRSSHELSIITYALHLAEADYRHHAYNKFWQIRFESKNQIFWPSNISNVVIKDRLNGKQSDHFYIPSSIDVETAAYGLLILIERSEIKQALPVMRWLISQQNSNGGFSSTQDTILALQALSQFASKLSKTSDISCKIRLGYNKKQTKLVKKNSSEILDNKSKEDVVYTLKARSLELEQLEVSETKLINSVDSAKIDSLTLNDKFIEINLKNQLLKKIPDYVEIEASGNGTAVVQVSWQYNLDKTAEEEPFFIETNLTSNDNQMNLQVCSYYKIANETNMAILEVELPSGYKVDYENLMYNLEDTNKKIKKIETSKADTNVIFYFDSIKNDNTCVDVPAGRINRVANSKPRAIKLYDYYNKVETSRIFYEPPSLKTCDICEKGDCDISCGRGFYVENNEISNEFLKDSANQSNTIILLELISLLIVIINFNSSII